MSVEDIARSGGATEQMIEFIREQMAFDKAFVVGFIEVNKRNPSKYVAEERLMVHFLKRGRKMLNAGMGRMQLKIAETDDLSDFIKVNRTIKEPV